MKKECRSELLEEMTEIRRYTVTARETGTSKHAYFVLFRPDFDPYLIRFLKYAEAIGPYYGVWRKLSCTQSGQKISAVLVQRGLSPHLAYRCYGLKPNAFSKIRQALANPVLRVYRINKRQGLRFEGVDGLPDFFFGEHVDAT